MGYRKVPLINRIVLRTSGRWVLPYWNERSMLESVSVNPGVWETQRKRRRGCSYFPDDHGETWYPSGTIRGKIPG